MKAARIKPGSVCHLQESHTKNDVGRQTSGQRSMTKFVESLKMKRNENVWEHAEGFSEADNTGEHTEVVIDHKKCHHEAYKGSSGLCG